MIVSPLMILTVLLHVFGNPLIIDIYSSMMNVIAWIVFGAINGALLYWIKPDKHIGGYIGATLLGSAGALFGGAVAGFVYENFRSLNIVMLVLLVMTICSLVLLISNMFVQRNRLS